MFYHIFHEAQIESTSTTLTQRNLHLPHVLMHKKIRHKSKMQYLRRKNCMREIIEFQSNIYVFQNIVSFYLDTIRLIYSFFQGLTQKYNIKCDKKSVALPQ